VKNVDNAPVVSRIQFNDYDSVINSNTNKVETVNAPKTFERLEEISTANALRKRMDEDGDDDDDDRIRIMDDNINLDDLGIFDFDDKNDKKPPVVQDVNYQLDIDELPSY
jgi:hypothetical protein